jgi:NitT/TauT family transport system permease protein
MSERLARAGLGALGLLVGLTAWWAVTALLPEPGSLLARFGPGDAFPALGRLVTSEHGLGHLAVTLRRLLVGLGLATAVGIPIGLAVGTSRRVAQATGPLFQLTRMISPLAWTPVAIIVFGVGDAPVYFLVAVAAVWPVLIGTAAGVEALDRGWLLVSRSLGATWLEQLRTIVLPGIRGHVATGLRVALGIAWVVIVPAEMLGVDSGLGYAILDARDRLAYDELMALILLIGAAGFVLDALAQRVARAGRAARSAGGARRRPAPATDAGALSSPAADVHASR